VRLESERGMKLRGRGAVTNSVKFTFFFPFSFFFFYRIP
jgi:hypothetical protein